MRKAIWYPAKKLCDSVGLVLLFVFVLISFFLPVATSGTFKEGNSGRKNEMEECPTDLLGGGTDCFAKDL